MCVVVLCLFQSAVCVRMHVSGAMRYSSASRCSILVEIVSTFIISPQCLHAGDGGVAYQSDKTKLSSKNKNWFAFREIAFCVRSFSVAQLAVCLIF